FSADTAANGTTNGDLVTGAASQTVSGTLSAPLGAGETVYVSLDDGTTWAAAATDGTNWSLGGVTLTGSNTLKVKVTDTAGNDGAVASRTYVLDSSAPTTTIGEVALSDDTGAADFVTRNAAQTLSGRLSAPLAEGERVFVSLDGGTTWRTATTDGTRWSVAGLTLPSAGTLKVKVADTAGNDGPVFSQAYAIDVNDPHTGSVAITGTPQIGAVLRASNTLADPDGVGPVSYRWQVTDGNGGWTDIAGATTDSYLPSAAELGHRLRVVATYTDTHGSVEEVASEASATVIPQPQPQLQPPTPPVPSTPPTPTPPTTPSAPPAAPPATFLPPSSPLNTPVTSGSPTMLEPPTPLATPTAPPSGASDTQRTPGTGISLTPTLTPPSQGGFQIAVLAPSSGAAGDGIVLARGISDTAVQAGSPAVIPVPHDAFAHANPNATVTLRAEQANGAALPPWIVFDASSGKFVVKASANVKGTVEVRVIARDNHGREAVATFKFVVGDGRTGAQRGAALERPAQPLAAAGRTGLAEQIRHAARPQGVGERLAALARTLTQGPWA
ncbi:MAG: hypothetical protein JSS57_21615, partial [Proteobacteria bacterium]|nr:hypothetical protein [Pseudomonadota bacterium]